MPVRFKSKLDDAIAAKTGLKSVSRPSEALAGRLVAKTPGKAPVGHSGVKYDLSKCEQIGEYYIVPGPPASFDVPHSMALFIVHTKKKEIYYRVIECDPDGKMKLRSRYKSEFESDRNKSAAEFYVSVLGPKASDEVPAPVLDRIQKHDLE